MLNSLSFCVFSYRAIVLRALPNLETLDNVNVTPEELAEAMKGGNAVQSQEEIYEDAYSNGQSQQQQMQQYEQQSQQQQNQQQPQQQYRQSSPVREVCWHSESTFYFFSSSIHTSLCPLSQYLIQFSYFKGQCPKRTTDKQTTPRIKYYNCSITSH